MKHLSSIFAFFFLLPSYNNVLYGFNSSPVDTQSFTVQPNTLLPLALSDDSLTLIDTKSITAAQNTSLTNSLSVLCNTDELKLDGSDDYIEIPDNPTLSPCPTCPFTAEAWVFRESGNPVQHIMGKRVGCTNPSPYWQMAFDAGGLSFGSTGYGLVLTGVDLPMNEWHHVAGVFDGAQFYFYLDCQLIGTGTGTIGAGAGASLKLGTSGTCPSNQYFGGKIDEVRVWNVARTQAEIQTGMFECVNGSEPGLAGAWNLNEGSGTTAQDISGNGNDGTLINGPIWMASTLSVSPPTAVISPAIANVDCNNPTTTLTASGGSSYIWSTSENTSSITVTPPNTTTYTVTVTNSTGCTDSESADVIVDNTPPTAAISPANATIDCITTSVTLTASGGGTYEWDNNLGTNQAVTVTPSSTTTFTVTVTAANGCTDTESITVIVEIIPPILSPSITAATCGQSNGAAESNASGGVSPYTYIWSNGETSPGISNLVAGTYTVTVSGANGCTASATAIVPNDNIAINITGTTTPLTSCLIDNGAVDITITPSQPYSFLWSNGETSEDITGLIDGSYTVTVSLGTSCSAEQNFIVENNAIPPVLTSVATNTTCGLNDGIVDLSVSGGAMPYTFNWSNSASTEDLNNVPAGTYSVTVTDGNGCSQMETSIVENNNITINVSGIATPLTSCISDNGAVDITVTPSQSYSFLWSNGATSEDITNLSDGTYTVTVSFGSSCSAEESFNVTNNAIPPVLTSTVTNTTCSMNDGIVDLSVSGGAMPYTFNWSNSASTEDLNNVPAGTYTVTVTDGNGCSGVETSVVANNNIAINVSGVSTPLTSCISDNGAVDITATPSQSYSFLWSNGATSEDITGLSDGTYTVTVSLGTSCSAEQNFNVANNAVPPVLTSTTNNTTCGMNDGIVDLSVNGGAMPYTFNWSNSATTEDLINVLAGNYTVTVTDGNGCSAEETSNVANDNIFISVSGTATPLTSCITANGAVNITVTPGHPYTFLWSNGMTTEDITNLDVGPYTVTVSLGTTCTTEENFSVEDNALIPILATTATPATCGQNNGAIDLTVNSGEAPYTFFWSNSETTEDLTDIAEGNYSVNVTGANGCMTTTSATVANNTVFIQVQGATTPNTSCSASNGTVSLSLMPAGSYNFVWSNGETTQDISNLESGTYTVTATLGTTCSTTESFVVEDNTSPPVLSQTVTAAVCGQNNGAIDLTVNGTASPYSYLWSNGAMTEDLTGIGPDDYSVTVTDANDCTETMVINVPNNSNQFTVNGIVSPLTSCTASNGAVDLEISPAGPYSYSWSNGETTQDLFNVDAGIYTVIVSAVGSCTASATFTVEDETTFPVLSPMVTTATCGESNGDIELSVSGGQLPYTYLWSNGADSQNLTNVISDFYEVTVSGSNGCSTIIGTNVPDNSITINLDATVTANTSCLASTGVVDLSVSPVETYDYDWSNGATTQDLTNVEAGPYSVTVTLGNTCVSTASYIVTEDAFPPSLSQVITHDTCSSGNGSIDLTLSGGLTPFTFEWSNGESSEDLIDLTAGIYNLTVTGTDGCSSTAISEVQNNDISISINGVTNDNTSCQQPNGNITLNISPPGIYNYEWSNNIFTQNQNDLPSGDYEITVTTGVSCSASTLFTIVDKTEVPTISHTVIPATCGASNGGIELLVNGGQPPYTFAWANGQTTEVIIDLASGIYEVTVTDMNGCFATENINVPNNSNNFSLAAAMTPNSLCTGVNGSLNLTVTPDGIYSFNWSNGETSEDLANISSGNYTVTVNDGTGCTASASYTVDENLPELSISGTTENIDCFGGSEGAIDLTISGGENPYNFAWSPSIPGNPEDPFNLSPGNYSVTVTDANGCNNEADFLIEQPISMLQVSCTTINNVSVPGGNDGSASLDILGGTSPYSVNWNGGSQDNLAAGIFNINNLVEGTYDVTVTDANDCEESCSFIIFDGGCMLSLSSSLLNAGCENVCDGSINLTVSGNNGVLSYSWSDPGLGNVPDITGLCAGNYSVTITDGAGCTLTESFNIVAAFSLPLVSSNITHSFCGQGNGSIALIVSGTSPPYTYDWSNGETGESLNNLTSGNYSVTVSDSNGCDVISSMEVEEETIVPVISGSIITNTSCISGNGGISLSVLPGANYSYAWSNGETLQNISNLSAGTFTVTVSAGPVCTASETFLVDDEISLPNISVTTSPASCNQSNGSLDLTATGQQPLGFQWSNGATSEDLVNIPSGIYEVTVTDNSGCTSNATVEVSAVPSNLSANIEQAISYNGYGVSCPGAADGSLNANGANGAEPYHYLWSNGSTEQNTENLNAGNHTLTLTDAIGCSDTVDFLITQPPPLELQIDISSPGCEGQAEGSLFLDVEGGVPPYLHSLDNDAFQSALQYDGLEAGDYEVIIQDANGCELTTPVTLETPNAPTLFFAQSEEMLHQGDSLQLIPSIIGLADSLQWSPASGLSCTGCLTPWATPIESITYSLTVWNAEGCSATTSLFVQVNKQARIFVPNAFSPNDDGINDLLQVYAGAEVTNILSFSIFDRWGEKIFAAKNIEPNTAQGWNGKFKGQPVQSSIAVWVAEIELIGGRLEVIKGEIMIVR